MRQDLIDAGIEFRPSHFFRYTKGERKGQWDLNISFYTDAMRKFGYTIDQHVEKVILKDRCALVVMKCDLYKNNDCTQRISQGFASNACDESQMNFSALAQKASTWAIKRAVDMAIGLSDEEIQEIAAEIGLGTRNKFTSRSQVPDEEPQTPPELPPEDESLNDALLE